MEEEILDGSNEMATMFLDLRINNKSDEKDLKNDLFDNSDKETKSDSALTGR
jgi:hypothetical protein